MRVLGIDPGLVNLGWGIIDVHGSKISHISNGICKSSAQKELPFRLAELYDQLSAVIAQYQPDTSAVEKTFVNKDAAGSLKLGQARAVCLLAPAKAGIDVAEYAPNTIKKVVVGVGHADKAQVTHMVKMQLPKVQIAGVDASDALAIALCHAHHSQFSNKLQTAIEKAGAA